MSKPNGAKPDAVPTARSRRWWNGAMVLISVAAAVGAVVLLNYVVYWQYRSMSPGARSYWRYDLTAQRRYSLSPQTRVVLEGLGREHRVVTMLGGTDGTAEQDQRIRDLVDEYARASVWVETAHLDLGKTDSGRDGVLEEMDTMFASDTASIREAIDEGLVIIERCNERVALIEQGLSAIVENQIAMSSRDAQRLTDLHSQYLRLQDQSKAIEAERNKALGKRWRERLRQPGESVVVSDRFGQSMPDYTALMAQIQQYVIQLITQTLPDTPMKADQIRRGIASRVNPLAPPEEQADTTTAQNTLAQLTQQVPQLQRQLGQEVAPLLSVAPPRRYEEARRILNDEPCVLITAGGDARAIPARLLFRGGGPNGTGEVNDLFVGEEQLTGALISMALDPPPMIVFIRSNTGQRALSSISPDQQRLEGIYDHTANRLLNMDFEVVEWERPLDEPPPEPAEGQPVVWITMPFLKPDARYPRSLDMELKQKVMAFIDERVSLGDGAMVMLSYNPDTDPELNGDSDPDPLTALLTRFGIVAQLYQNVTQLINEDEDTGRSRYGTEFIVERWPDTSLTGRSLEGIATHFFQPMPLRLHTAEGVTTHALVELQAPAMYVQRTVPDKEGLFSPEPDSKQERVVIGASAERGEGRLVALGDPTWAIDNITSLAVLPDGTVGPGLADKPGARIAYPGNSDLFVSCVCWLAHEEQLIAASARTQDIRRIPAVASATLSAYRMLLWGGMPACIFGLGVIVGLVRRRA